MSWTPIYCPGRDYKYRHNMHICLCFRPSTIYTLRSSLSAADKLGQWKKKTRKRNMHRKLVDLEKGCNRLTHQIGIIRPAAFASEVFPLSCIQDKSASRITPPPAFLVIWRERKTATADHVGDRCWKHSTRSGCAARTKALLPDMPRKLAGQHFLKRY